MLPGTVSATPVPAPLQTSTPAHTLGCSATTAPAHIPSDSLLPLAYWYGHGETKRNPLLLDRLIRNLGENVWDRLEDDPQGETVMLLEILRVLSRFIVCRTGIGHHCGYACIVRCEYVTKRT